MRKLKNTMPASEGSGGKGFYMKKKITWKDRLKYWFDGKMSQGSMGLLKLLVVVTVIFVLVMALIMQALRTTILYEYNTFGARLYASFAAAITGFLPFYSDGDVQYRTMIMIAAVYGIFVSSILIGIISTGLDEKINSLKKGSATILEENHLVVLGFEAGEYSLIQELVHGADRRRCCIVVAGETDREEMEDSIRQNVKCPKNVRILCRTINLFDPGTLERLSLAEARTVLISPTDVDRTVRTLLAVTRILHDVPGNKVKTIAVLSENDYRIPEAVLEKNNILLLHSEGTIARIMAHACTQPGLSQTMMEMFHFDGSEMHTISLPGAEGLSFEELLCRVDKAFPIGICRGKEIHLNPEPGMKMEAGDRLLVFCEESESAKLLPASELPPMGELPPSGSPQDAGRVILIGCNEFLPTILYELPENVPSVTLADVEPAYRDEALKAAARRETPLSVSFFEKDTAELSALEELIKDADHVVVLSDHENGENESDMQHIFTVLNLRDVRERLGLHFNITAEMRREANQNLLIPDNETEFLVSSNMSSLFLAQLSESPELIRVFDELLTNEGNEVYLKTAEELNCAGTRTVLELRRRLISQRYVMIGIMRAESFKCSFDLCLGDSLTLNPEDKLIVIGEN